MNMGSTKKEKHSRGKWRAMNGTNKKGGGKNAGTGFLKSIQGEGESLFPEKMRGAVETPPKR